MGHFLQDLRYGVRSLLHAPTFTVLTVLTLTLAIGVNSAICSMVSVIFFAEMPMADQDTAVFLWRNNAERGVDRMGTSLPDLLDLREQAESFDAVVAMARRPGVLTGVEEPTRITVGLMTADMAQTWGVDPFSGRNFLPGEDRAGADRVAQLSHGMWERRFGSDPGVIGEIVKVDGQPTTIVGVANPLMEFGDMAAVDVWVPIEVDTPDASRDANGLFLTARLAPGVTIEQAQAEVDQINRQLEERYPETNRGWAFLVQDFQSGLADNTFWVIMALLGITVGLVMLIACSNVATMTLARATGRAQELAVRAAIGAGRGRILRQLVTESMMLSLAAGALGLLVTRGVIYGLTWLVGDNGGMSSFFKMLSIDMRVLGFTLVVSLLAPVLFGLLPAWRSSRADLAATLKEGGRTSADPVSLRDRRVLVATQVSLAIALMVVAGLMLRSLVELRTLDYHHAPDSVLTMRVDMPELNYPDLEMVRQFRAEVTQRVENTPGVVRAVWMNDRPVADLVGTVSFEVAGAELREEEQRPFAFPLVVSPNYFDLAKVAPASGRLFGSEDRSDTAPVVVVNEEAVDRFWPDADPIGQEIKIGDGEWLTVVGVAANEIFPDPTNPVVPQVYLPIDQNTRRTGALLLEAIGDPLELTTPARQAVLAVDPEQPIADVRTQGRIYADGLSSFNAIASMLGVFAGFALVMAGAGIYGVLSFMVAERTREFGIRMALGASRSTVRQMVMRNTSVLIIVGVVVGLAMAFGLGQILASALPDVNPGDPIVYSSVGLVLFLVAVLAAWIPARRATRVEPVVALKAD